MLSNYQNKSAAAQAARYITKTEAPRRKPPESGHKPENRSLPAQAGDIGHRTEAGQAFVHRSPSSGL